MCLCPKVAKGFVSMHHQRPKLYREKGWAILEREPTGGLAIPLELSRSAEMNI